MIVYHGTIFPIQAIDPKRFKLEHANQSEKFANSVNVCFGEPETDKELRRIAMVLDHRFEDACSYGYSRWGDIDIDVGDIYVEIKQRMEQNHIKLAFAEAEAAYGRTAYYVVCSRFRSFAQAGYQKEALAKIDEFKLKYKRKPAFVDELKKSEAIFRNNTGLHKSHIAL